MKRRSRRWRITVFLVPTLLGTGAAVGIDQFHRFDVPAVVALLAAGALASVLLDEGRGEAVMLEETALDAIAPWNGAIEHLTYLREAVRRSIAAPDSSADGVRALCEEIVNFRRGRLGSSRGAPRDGANGHGLSPGLVAFLERRPVTSSGELARLVEEVRSL